MSGETSSGSTAPFGAGEPGGRVALVTINYMDRSALGVVPQAVRGEFDGGGGEIGLSVLVVPVDVRDLSVPIGVMLDRFMARKHRLHGRRVLVAGKMAAGAPAAFSR